MLNPRFTRFIPALFFMMLAFPLQAALQDMAGNPKSLDDYSGKGKWLVVMIWASDCHVCNREAQEYVDFHFLHSDSDAEVLGVSIDGQAKKAEALKFIDRHKINFTNLIGEPDEVGSLFSELTGTAFVGTPSFLIFDPKGVLKAQQVGAVPTNLIEEFMQRQSVASAGQ